MLMLTSHRYTVLRRCSSMLFLFACMLLLLSACAAGTTAPTSVPATVAATEVAAAEPTQPPNAAATTPPVEAATTESAPTAELLVVRLGVNAEFEPFVFKDEAGQVVGFDIDLINALAQAGHFEVTYVDLPFEELLSQVEAGAIDAAISAITVTEERAERVSFSAVYFQSGQAPVSYYNPGQGLAVRVDETTIVGAESLTTTVKVGVKADTTGAAFVADETDAQVVVFPEAVDALNALHKGTVDAVVVDIPVIVRYIGNNATAGIRITGGPLTDELYAIAVNPTRSDILDRINAALAQIQANGAYDRIFEKWFGLP